MAFRPRLRAGIRGAIAMTLGAIAVGVGIPGVYYLLNGTASGDHFTGLLSIVAGFVLLTAGLLTLWKGRRQEGSRRRRYGRRAAIVAAAVSILVFVAFPVGLATSTRTWARGR